jgi:hypothetical protein
MHDSTIIMSQDTMLLNEPGLNSAIATEPIAATARGFAASPQLEAIARDVYEIDPLCDPRWAALVDNHPQASVFHTAQWLRALQVAYDYEPVAITTSSPATPLSNALVFCRIRSPLTGRRLVSLPFSDHCEPLVSHSDEFDELILHAKASLSPGKWKYLEVRPVSHYPGSRTGFGVSLTYQFHRLDLQRSATELFATFHKDCVQRKIRRAEREHLKYEEGSSEALLTKFYRLMVITRRRHFLPPQPLAWFRALIASFGSDLKIRIASKDEHPVAGILTLAHNRTMVYKYGCSDPAYNKFGGTAFLFWQAVQDAIAIGCAELDMGRSDIDNAGLIAFKEHWGARGTVLRYWTYPNQPQNPRSAWQKNLAKRVVSAAPDAVLQAVGTILYRHIG